MLNKQDLIDMLRNHFDTLALGNEVIDRTDTLLTAGLDMFEEYKQCEFKKHRLKDSAQINQLYELIKLAYDLIAETNYSWEVVEAERRIDAIRKENSEVSA